MKRREFLISTAAATGALGLALPKMASAASPAFLPLKAAPTKTQILPDEAPSMVWGFNDEQPGPTLRVKQGERVQVSLQNALPEPTAVHWHGIRIDNAMDGAPELTQSVVEPDASFDYDFVAPDAGTYWYHAHNRSLEQVARGLFGALIIEEETPPEVDHDIIAILDDWRINQDGSLDEIFDNSMDLSHDGRLGNFAKVIFKDAPETIKTGERVRFRILNAATDRIFDLKITGLDGKVVALDGMPLGQPQNLGALSLAPAQRVDVIADVVDEKIDFLFVTGEEDYPLGILSTNGEQAARTAAIEALPANAIREPNFDDVQTIELRLQGGMMAAATATGAIWSISDQSDITAEPLATIKKGQTVRLKLINETVFPHGIHIHGHHFQSEEALGLGPLRDTYVVERDETLTMIGVLDNPGKWLVHCHMLAHQTAGMKTWIDVQDA